MALIFDYLRSNERPVKAAAKKAKKAPKKASKKKGK